MKSTVTASEPRPGSDPSLIRSLELCGPAGRLEALLNEGAHNFPCAAVLCHPHPLGGGTLHNKVVYHAMRVLNAPEWGFGLPVLRFNFRGAGRSQGRYDGQAEAGDVLAALAWLEAEYRVPILLAGFSFGAAMALAACCGTRSGVPGAASVRSLAALGLPLEGFNRTYSYPHVTGCYLDKLFLSGDCDQFADSGQLRSLVDSCAEPKKLLLIAGADHFFSGKLEQMQQALAQWVKEQVL